MGDSEDEEEELIVYANFEDGTVEKEIFQIPNVKLKIIGLDSDTPLVQLRDSTFVGKWSDTVGTKLLLEEDPSPEQVDPTFTVIPDTMLRYKCQTKKALELSRIFLKPKTGSRCDVVGENDEANNEAVMDNDDANEALKDVIECTIKSESCNSELIENIVNDALVKQEMT